MGNLLIEVLSVCLIVTVAKCEVRFVCPRPITADSTIQSGSCYRGSSEFLKEYTEIWPGLLTVEYEETVIRKESVMKIVLVDMSSNNEPCTLLDNIPHNKGHIKTASSNCHSTWYPLGRCQTSTFLTLTIPDIKCDKCALQLIQITMPNEHASFCEERDCIKYHSCVNIRIRPTDPNTALTTANCTTFYKDKIMEKWAYHGPDIYRPEKLHDDRFLPEYFTFVDQQWRNLITFEIKIPEDDVTVRNCKLYRHRGAKRAMYELTRVGVESNHYRGTLPTNKNKNFRRAYAFGGPVVRISYDDKNEKIQDFHYTTKLTIQDISPYAPRSMVYAPSGWVNCTNHFVSVGIRYPDVVYPRGHCAPIPAQYGVALINQTNEPSGIVTFLSSGDILHLRAVMPRPRAEWNVSYDGTEKLPSKLIRENTLKANLPTTNLPESFEINGKDTDGETYRLTGTSKKALQATVYHFGGIYALAILSLVGTDRYRVQYFLKNIGSRTPIPTQVVLTYPSYGDIIHNVTNGIVPMSYRNFNFGGWSTDATFQGTGDEFFIRSGHFGLQSTHKKRPEYTFTAKFDVPGKDFCLNSKHVFCDVIYLNKYSRSAIDRVYADPYGVMSMTQMTAGKYSIRIFVRGLRSKEIVDAAYFYTGTPDDTTTRKVFSSKFTYPAVEAKIATFSAVVSLNDDLKTLWTRGQLYVAVRLSMAGVISSQTPPPTTTPISTSKPSTKPQPSTKPGPSTVFSTTKRVSSTKKTDDPKQPGTKTTFKTRPPAPGNTVGVSLLTTTAGTCGKSAHGPIVMLCAIVGYVYNIA